MFSVLNVNIRSSNLATLWISLESISDLPKVVIQLFVDLV
jgi:hypothetical protein